MHSIIERLGFFFYVKSERSVSVEGAVFYSVVRKADLGRPGAAWRNRGVGGEERGGRTWGTELQGGVEALLWEQRPEGPSAE